LAVDLGSGHHVAAYVMGGLVKCGRLIAFAGALCLASGSAMVQGGEMLQLFSGVLAAARAQASQKA